MKVQVCPTFDPDIGACTGPLEWVDAVELVEAGTQPWLSGEDAVTVALAIGLVWAAAWAIRALAQSLHAHMR
ncbi:MULTISPECIES: hypothetical protein [Halomonas]|uniref:Uncharacterized protein n=2 Tax=Halomonas TaxID=2745 RepID=A0ABQ0UA86_9GAMM|nr:MULTISPECIES: hypothetical protein [Halomonas]PSJ21946.1 hypothetical protein CVH10_09810 [Halomonas sp. ND22Bw]KGE78925.1 hypothetical protein FP66_01170 [Halomonas salina]MDR5891167.1 hypothetical protein [Halomonas salina]WJY08217.1 hypothetical protein QWG60_04715 [Halomonas halophila]GEK74653.1 hypothetical protein HHA04nite_31970 [Halomonas halophila]